MGIKPNILIIVVLLLLTTCLWSVSSTVADDIVPEEPSKSGHLSRSISSRPSIRSRAMTAATTTSDVIRFYPSEPEASTRRPTTLVSVGEESQQVDIRESGPPASSSSSPPPPLPPHLERTRSRSRILNRRLQHSSYGSIAVLLFLCGLFLLTSVVYTLAFMFIVRVGKLRFDPARFPEGRIYFFSCGGTGSVGGGGGYCYLPLPLFYRIYAMEPTSGRIINVRGWARPHQYGMSATEAVAADAIVLGRERKKALMELLSESGLVYTVDPDGRFVDGGYRGTMDVEFGQTCEGGRGQDGVILTPRSMGVELPVDDERATEDVGLEGDAREGRSVSDPSLAILSPSACSHYGQTQDEESAAMDHCASRSYGSEMMDIALYPPVPVHAPSFRFDSVPPLPERLGPQDHTCDSFHGAAYAETADGWRLYQQDREAQAAASLKELDESGCNVCPICLDRYVPGDKYVAPCHVCSHRYHRDCILDWFAQKSRNTGCPCCRRDIIDNTIVEIKMERFRIMQLFNTLGGR